MRSTSWRRRQSTRSSRRRCEEHNPSPHWVGHQKLTIAQHSSGNKKAEDDAKKETDGKVKEVEELGNKSGSKVVEQLIAAVTNAEPKPRKD